MIANFIYFITFLSEARLLYFDNYLIFIRPFKSLDYNYQCPCFDKIKLSKGFLRSWGYLLLLQVTGVWFRCYMVFLVVQIYNFL